MELHDEHTCRICLSPESGCIKITSSINVRFGRISEMVLYCTGLEFTNNETLPQMICNECALHLNVAYAFKKKVIHAENKYLDALATAEANEDRKPGVQTTSMTNGNGGEEEPLESHLEVEQKVIPSEHPLQNGDDEETNFKFGQGTLMAYFNSNELIVLSDTDSECTVSDTEMEPVVTLVESREANLECPCCDEVFPNHRILKNHVDSHPNKSCKICRRQCYQTPQLLLHFSSHSTSINGFPCSQCPFRGKSQISLRNHIRIHVNKAYKCLTCERVMPDLERTRNHLILDHKLDISTDELFRSYTAEAQASDLNKCHICGRSLSNYSSLQIHLRLHERDKLNYCYVCKASFHRDQKMYLHFKTAHPGQKPYKCSNGHCEQTFDTVKRYDQHMRIAKQDQALPAVPSRVSTGPKPSDFECFICNMRFASEMDRNSHAKTHPKMICKKCKQVYVQFRTLLDHYDYHHPNGEWSGVFKCRSCNRTFLTTRSCSNHERMHSKMNTTT